MSKQKYINLKSPVGRVAFPKVFTPEADDQDKLKYGMVLIFDKEAQATEEYKKLIKAIHDKRVEKWGTDKARWPKDLKGGLKRCEDVTWSSGEIGCTMISLSKKFNPEEPQKKPQVVDLKKGVTISAESGEFYSGCYAQVSMAVGWFDIPKSRGISLLLNNVGKVKDGVRMDGTKSAFEDFGINPTDVVASDGKVAELEELSEADYL